MTKLSPLAPVQKKYSADWWRNLRPERIGDETEKLVEKVLAEWNRRAAFAWHRFPDTKAARGMLVAQPSDYLWFAKPYGGLLEVKACGHATRLAKDKVRQLGMLTKFEMAGADNILLVNHYLEGVWRAVPPRQLDPGASSWDLSGFQAHPSAEAALRSMGWFDVC